MPESNRNRFVLFAVAAALAAAILAAAAPADMPQAADAEEDSSWAAETYRGVVREAFLIMPPALAAVVGPHRDAILDGAAAPLHEHRKGKHVFDPESKKGDLPEALDRAVAEGLKVIEEQRPLRDLAYQVGVMSHLAADFASPLRTAPKHPLTRRIEADFAGYTLRMQPRFRPTFAGYPKAFLARELRRFMEPSASASHARQPLIVRAYYPNGEKGERADSSAFTVRSAAFGVASVSYSQAVSGTALVWTHFWHQARGDLKGTPFLAPEHMREEGPRQSSPPKPERIRQ